MLYILTSVLSVVLANQLGFQRMVDDQKLTLERLRNVTFPIWEQNTPISHGFLCYLKPEDFQAKAAYANHSTSYLLVMYGLFKVEQASSRFAMRSSSAILAITLLSGALLWLLSQISVSRIRFGRALVLLATLAFVLTQSGFWVPAARFNVDNVFLLQLPFLVVASGLLAQKSISALSKWAFLSVFTLLFPMSAALIALLLVAYSIRLSGLRVAYLKEGAILFAASVIVYLQPIVVSKALGFTSLNSGWLFRSGLDGDMRFFGNALSSIIHPVDPRPLYIIAVPVILALLQITIMRVSGPLMGKTKFGPINYPLFYACFSAPYLFSCLFWPQSVSIHPYLYDYFLIGLTVVFIFINTARFKVLTRPVAAWCIGFAFLVSFNLQKIAQSSRHVGAYYAPWDAVPASK